MKIKAALAITLSCAGVGAATPQWDWGNVVDDGPFAAGYADSKAICRSVRLREPPAADRPDAAARTPLQGCSSETLYYGIGVKADPLRARQCAFIEAETPDEGGLFAGRAMLMTIYANGVGARRDLDVATHLACGIEGAPAESDGRVVHLAELKSTGWTGRDFHFCNDITSGYAMGFCALHDSEIAGAKREAALNSLAAGWTAREQAAFRSLRQAHSAFAEAHGSNEVDMSGTARAAMAIEAEETLRDEFLEMLKLLAAGKAPRGGAAQYRAADTRLNAAYRKVMRSAEEDYPGTVSKDGVRTAQRAWLVYRDAFMTFAAVKYPSVGRDGIASWVTDKRWAMLEPEE